VVEVEVHIQEQEELQVPVVEAQVKHTHLQERYYTVIMVLQIPEAVVEPKVEQVEVE
jgi:hypothetical protein